MSLTNDRLAQRLGVIFGFFGVLLGALSAHGSIHDFLATHPPALELWRTALQYQWLHALALLAVGQSAVPQRGTGIFWLIGTVFFAGSLYGLALFPTAKWLGPITPLGGLSLLIGWALLWWRLVPSGKR